MKCTKQRKCCEGACGDDHHNPIINDISVLVGGCWQGFPFSMLLLSVLLYSPRCFLPNEPCTSQPSTWQSGVTVTISHWSEKGKVDVCKIQKKDSDLFWTFLHHHQAKTWLCPVQAAELYPQQWDSHATGPRTQRGVTPPSFTQRLCIKLTSSAVSTLWTESN